MSNYQWILLGLLGSSACLSPGEDVGEHEQVLEGAALATPFQRARAVKINGCTATRITARYPLTSAHAIRRSERP